MSERVLIVDDDAAVLRMLYKVVRSNDLEADTAETGEDALQKIARNRYALMLLDINLHGIDGFTVIEKLRAAGNTLPIIIISGRKEDYDTLYGLGIGADDYITKPFNPVTLGAKIKAILRRSSGSEMNRMITAGPFSYDTSTLRLYKNGGEIILTSKENAMMKLFLDNVDRIFSKDMLYDMIWGSALVDDNTIMVYINRLRQKIEDDPEHPRFIQNVRGIGYRFVL
ncbi:MAG: response regulator transcription factor [Clostridiales bacterium]|nr:response regulator transcription factor [Candidatus Cacconaster stercorequi]